MPEPTFNRTIHPAAIARLTDGKTSPGLQGSFTVAEGLQTLLAGSGLAYRFTAADAVAIQAAAPRTLGRLG